jgi:hypothetical protein
MEEPNILIKTALTDAVQKVNEGLDPTSALKKVASDLDLNPNYIQRVGEALNVALHYKHFKTASDRSVEFDIADIPKAIEDTFTLTDKTAAQYVSDNFADSYADEHVFNYNRILSNPVYKRAFLEVSGAVETHDSYPTTFRTIYEKSANYISKLAKEAEETEIAGVEATLRLNEKFSELSDEFRRDPGYRAAFEEFESQVFAKHGEASLPYLDLLHKTACSHEERGVHDAGYMMFEQCKEAGMFDDLMQAAQAMVVLEQKTKEASENLAFERAFLKEAHVLLGKTAAEEKQETKEESAEESSEHEETEDEDPVLAAIKKKASDSEYSVIPKYTKDPVLEQSLEKEASMGMGTGGGFGKVFGGLLDTALHAASAPLSEAFTHGLKKQPIKPNLTLENMERKLLLQELMLTDPILSKINPAKVARAFEQILRLSPEISKEKEVVRAELRAMVSSQALSKFDADLMTKLDVGMLKRRIATQEFNKGEIQNFRL